MPMIIQTVDDIMAAEKRDMAFLHFPPIGDRFDYSEEAQSRHFKWFESVGVSFAMAATRGWLSGDTGLYAVYFTGLDDPRIAQYSALFEDSEGMSLVPDEYQISILPYEAWLKNPPPVREEGDDW